MMNKENTNNGGINFIGVLQILFIALKLTGVITWGWFYVLMPIVVSISIIILVGIIWLVLEVMSK
jgi:hypothetical protein